MSSTTTKQPVKMPLIYSPACTLSSTQSKQRSQEANWTALTAISDSCWEECLFWAFSPLFFFLSSSSSHNSKIQAGPVAGCCGYWKGNVSRDQEGKQKQAPPPYNITGYKEKSSLRRHNRRLEEVGVVIWGKAGVKRALRVWNVPAAGCQDTEIAHNKTARHSCTLPRVAAWPAGYEQALQPREVI